MNFLVGEYENAVAGFELVFKASTSDTKAIYQLSESLYSLGRFEQALDWIERLIAEAPEEIHFWMMKARTLACLGQEHVALSILHRFLPSFADYVHLRIALAGQYYRIGEFENALLELDRALDIDSNLSTSYLIRANVRFALGRVEKAVADCYYANNLQPGNTWSSLVLAWIFATTSNSNHRSLTEAKRLVGSAIDQLSIKKENLQFRLWRCQAAIHASESEFESAVGQQQLVINDPHASAWMRELDQRLLSDYQSNHPPSI